MIRNRVVSDEPIDLDPNELLGLSQIAKVSGGVGKTGGLGQVLSKIGPEGPPPTDPARRPLHSRLLSKVGEKLPSLVAPGATELNQPSLKTFPGSRANPVAHYAALIARNRNVAVPTFVASLKDPVVQHCGPETASSRRSKGHYEAPQLP